MFKNKKAQGLPITTIILVVIGLIVLVVLIAVFTGRIGIFSGEIEKTKTCSSICSSLGKNVVKAIAKECTGDKRHIWGTFSDVSGQGVEEEAIPDSMNCEKTVDGIKKTNQPCNNYVPPKMADNVCCCN